ncbi:MAG: YitT family protein [Faecousia sp.]
MKQTKREMLRNSLMIFFGSTLFALGFDLFLEPSGINCGGVSGIAMLVVYATQSKWLTVGILSAMINIPLFFFGYRQIGKYFFFGSMFGMLISSVGFDLFAKLLPIVQMDPLVAAIFGGVAVGAGLGVVFLAGASTGGTDIVARLLKLKFRNFPIGKIMLCMDLMIAVATGIVYRQFTNTLYSIVTLYLSSVVLDKVVYGFDYAKVALIISDKYEEIATAIDGKLDRGVTLLQGQGFYKRSDKYVLLSAVKKKQLAQLKELVMGIDPEAFIILQDAQQVLGDGFKRYDRFEL